MGSASWSVALLTLLLGLVAVGASSCHLLLAVAAWAALAYRKRIRVIIAVLPRDLTAMVKYIRLTIHVHKLRTNDSTVFSVFDELVSQHPKKACLIFEGSVWTYEDVQSYSMKVANTFSHAGYKKGDAVALILNNSPEYVGVWLGASRIGVITALVNHNLRSQPLVHTLNICKARAVIFGKEFSQGVQEIKTSLDSSMDYFQIGGIDRECSEVKSLESFLSSAPSSQLKAEKHGFKDQLIYIYTSGTTGLPKAAIVPHSRFLLVAVASRYMLPVKDDDIIYNPLPLYHSSGAFLGVGNALLNGATCVLRTKFSASAYWPECAQYKCTVGLYIGEMCRYLLSVPPKPEDRMHCVRVMFGNGMRATIWKKFVDRFNIKEVREFYGATEGNTNIVNLDNTVGAVGFLPQIAPRKLFPLALVKINDETHEVLRDDNGLCKLCDYGEPGMCVGKVSSSNEAHQFHGYVDKAASNSKIIFDVFEKGDKAFLSGDILVMDDYGYLYFKDRIGDTFRWKGENVATAEIESVISNTTGFKNITVFGVEVPGAEGRAGMAVIEDPEQQIDIQKLADGLCKTLPSYARPLFLRIVKQLELTGTFKVKKNALQNEGFNPSVITDKLYFLDKNSYIPLTSEVYEKIVTGLIRL